MIRKFRNSDKKQVFSLIESVIREIFNFNLTGVSDLENVSEQYNNKGGTFYVAIEESKTSSNKHGSNKQVKNKYIRSNS